MKRLAIIIDYTVAIISLAAVSVIVAVCERQERESQR